MSLVGYKLGGLTGMGIAFSVSYLTYTIILFVIARRRYDFWLSREFCKEFFIQLILVVLCFGSIMMLPSPIKYVVGSFVAIISFMLSFRGLNSKIDFKSALIQIKNRKKA